MYPAPASHLLSQKSALPRACAHSSEGKRQGDLSDPPKDQQSRLHDPLYLTKHQNRVAYPHLRVATIHHANGLMGRIKRQGTRWQEAFRTCLRK